MAAKYLNTSALALLDRNDHDLIYMAYHYAIAEKQGNAQRDALDKARGGED